MCKGGRCWTAYTAKGAPPSRHTYLRLVLYEVLGIRLVHSGQKFQNLSWHYDSFFLVNNVWNVIYCDSSSSSMVLKQKLDPKKIYLLLTFLYQSAIRSNFVIFRKQKCLIICGPKIENSCHSVVCIDQKYVYVFLYSVSRTQSWWYVKFLFYRTMHSIYIWILNSEAGTSQVRHDRF